MTVSTPNLHLTHTHLKLPHPQPGIAKNIENEMSFIAGFTKNKSNGTGKDHFVMRHFHPVPKTSLLTVTGPGGPQC